MAVQVSVKQNQVNIEQGKANPDKKHDILPRATLQLADHAPVVWLPAWGSAGEPFIWDAL
ncbi:hypothetical protein E2C01_031920 [Portunus trituberculatus]|uniref:Uncharacterized protein n=1 Tax=Portunus trituberculatus TaxID=210409 RepID=A0A5B7F1D5_PORTR|nr:hypothetical protein [Portunus trituberculatus]